MWRCISVYLSRWSKDCGRILLRDLVLALAARWTLRGYVMGWHKQIEGTPGKSGVEIVIQLGAKGSFSQRSVFVSHCQDKKQCMSANSQFLFGLCDWDTLLVWL